MTDERRCEPLLQEIREEAAELGAALGPGALDARVLAALARVPREEFVPPNAKPYAYVNVPLPIGYEQTISQPFIVAAMTDLLRTKPDDVVLEIGTGSGYQAAILSLLVRQVYSIEVIEALAAEAKERLARLGYHNVEVRQGDGYGGWPEHAPFDGIIVTAAAPRVPPPLVEQLRNGGRLVIPVDGWGGQDLLVIEKDPTGATSTRNVLPVAFVPLIRDRKSAGAGAS